MGKGARVYYDELGQWEDWLTEFAKKVVSPAREFRGSFSKIWHETCPGINLTGECNATSGEIVNAR